MKGCVTKMTVRELAERCNVHYNTMRKWLIDNEVPKRTKARNSQFLLTDEIIRKAETSFLGSEKRKEIKEEKMVEKDNNLVTHLVTQLEVKDRQIVKQQEQIDHLQRLLENQQILTLKAQDKVELLESKEVEMERGGFDKPEKGLGEKLSFWKRIFR